MRQGVARRLILHLVRAIAEIPQQERAVWRDELGTKLANHTIAGEEWMVFMVLNSLPVAEDLAGRPRAKVTRRLVSLHSVHGGKGSLPELGVKKSRGSKRRWGLL